MRQNNLRLIQFNKAINEALYLAMKKSNDVVIIGEGVPDPGSIFDTTKNLLNTFGENRVFDMPLSENGITGVCIGAAQRGLRPILVHQRLDFSLLSLDQLINNAAKWFFMFNEKKSIPIVIRLIVGRGWGQGPQHSQNLHALFSMINGLKVITPSTAYNAKGLLLAAINDKNPVIFIEHRWLFNTESIVPKKIYYQKLDKAHIYRKGKDITVCTYSISVHQAKKAAEIIQKKFSISIEIVDLITLNPIDYKTIKNSLKKTGKIIFLDLATRNETIGHKVLSHLSENYLEYFKVSPIILCPDDYPSPTSHYLMKDYYVSDERLIKSILKLYGLQDKNVHKFLKKALHQNTPHDVPNLQFKGPF